jgi:hypothetical protein
MKQNALALRVVLEEQQPGIDRLVRHLNESIDTVRMSDFLLTKRLFVEMYSKVMLRLWDENQRAIKERAETDVVSSIRVGLWGVPVCCSANFFTSSKQP